MSNFMKKLIHLVLIFMCMIGIRAYGESFSDFSRYQIILERRPFGDAPPSAAELAASAKPAVPVGPSFIDSLRMCAITDGGGAVRVGFVDIKQKPLKTYFLFVGESEDGIEVVDANYEEESVTLRKGGEERRLTMSGGASATAMTSDPALQGRRISSSLRSRRTRIKRTREQIEEARRLAIEKKKPILQGEEYEEHIRQYNLDQIRNGGIPLPLALTPEEDAQLVSEGVLAPIE